MYFLSKMPANKDNVDADVAAALMGETLIDEDNDFLSNEEKAVLSAGIKEDALLIAKAETKKTQQSVVFEKSIEDEKLRLDLTIAFSAQNYESLTDKQIKEAIFELKKEPFSEKVNSENYIKIYPKDMQKEFVKVIIADNISETDEHIRKKLVEFLESLLK
jgi:hypothetical protein